MNTQVTAQKYQTKTSGLYYVNDFVQGYTRKKQGRGFRYLMLSNKPVKDKRILKRIQSLAIPPAWHEVWICKKIHGHIQATGIDEKGRKQYIYHPAWIDAQQVKKYDNLSVFIKKLPKIRRYVAKDLRGKKLSKQRVIAAIIRTIDKSQVRVGEKLYFERNGTRGATTLSSDNAVIHDANITLKFTGKSHVKRHINFNDKKVAAVIKSCQELDEQYLFSYQDKCGEMHAITSTDVNNYLLECCQFHITAKDFRTWWANVHFLEAITEVYLTNLDSRPLKKWIVTSVKHAAAELGHTPSVCRNSYLHPGLLKACENKTIYSWIQQLEKKHLRPKRYLVLAEQKLHYILTRIKDE